MPKMKSKGAVKGRFRVTKSGKVKASRPGRGHFRANKNGKQRRRSRTAFYLPNTWATAMKKMMGG